MAKPSPTQASAEEGAKPPVPGAPLDGVFVSSSRGVVDGDGSMQRPFKTLDAAIAKAETNGKRVLACAETYGEQLALRSGVSVYGYFSCDGGAFVLAADKRARVEAPTSPALVAEAIALPTRVEGFDVIAPDGSEASPSSIAARIADSHGLTLGKGSLRAGRGKDGADGVEPAQTAPTGADGTDGLAAGHCSTAPFTCTRIGGVNPAPGGDGAPATSCGGGLFGGRGGTGGVAGSRSPNGGYTAPATAGSGGNGETASGGTSEGATGNPGANGVDGSPGVQGGMGRIELREDGLHLVDGTAGTNGMPGQGGGGGGGSGSPGTNWEYAPSGGGGGAGGCPGVAGTPGGSGGASVGLHVVKSELALEDVSVVASAGGRAGVGTRGAAPTAGGAGGIGFTAETLILFGTPATIRGGAGGSGGAGGAAGVSGHGAPGPSIGMVVFGAKPAIKGGSIKPGQGGEGAPELAPALPATGPGQSVDVLVVQ